MAVFTELVKVRLQSLRAVSLSLFLFEASGSWDSVSSEFEHQISASSEASTTHSLEELSTQNFFEKHCCEIDVMTNKVVKESSIRKAIGEVITDGQVSVSVADPRSADAYLIAVSDQFEIMTGYSRSEILQKNCRFLNDGCTFDQADLVRLRPEKPFLGLDLMQYIYTHASDLSHQDRREDRGVLYCGLRESAEVAWRRAL